MSARPSSPSLSRALNLHIYALSALFQLSAYSVTQTGPESGIQRDLIEGFSVSLPPTQ